MRCPAGHWCCVLLNPDYEGQWCANNGHGCSRRRYVRGEDEMTQGEPIYRCLENCSWALCSECMPFSPRDLHQLVFGHRNIIGTKCTISETFDVDDDMAEFTGRPASIPGTIAGVDCGVLLIEARMAAGDKWIWVDNWQNKIAFDGNVDNELVPYSNTWEITVFPSGNVAFSPRHPPIPPHMRNTWTETWWQDSKRSIEKHLTREEKIAAAEMVGKAYWHSGFSNMDRFRTPLMDIFNATLVSEVKPAVFVCTEYIATEVHQSLVNAGSYGGRNHGLREEIVDSPSWENPFPWDMSRLLVQRGTAYIPSVIDIAALVTTKRHILWSQVRAYLGKCALSMPQITARVAEFMPFEWPSPASPWPAVDAAHRHQIFTTVAQIEDLQKHISFLYAKAVHELTGAWIDVPVLLGFRRWAWDSNSKQAGAVREL